MAVAGRPTLKVRFGSKAVNLIEHMLSTLLPKPTSPGNPGIANDSTPQLGCEDADPAHDLRQDRRRQVDAGAPPGRCARHDPDQRGRLAVHALPRRTADDGRVRPQLAPPARGDGRPCRGPAAAPACRWCSTFPPTRSPAGNGCAACSRSAGAAHRLHFLDVPDDVCKARLRQRNAAGTHAIHGQRCGVRRDHRLLRAALGRRGLRDDRLPRGVSGS